VARNGAAFGLNEAWAGVLAYTLQLYFDFSGYSDMAIGLARLFGIRLPMNFNSPYQATNIADFWRRWHVTLSRFLRDYLYIPLGGNRRGPARKYLNLFITMLIGGIWHGAGWTFVIWGALHGTYLLVFHAWQGWRDKRKKASEIQTSNTGGQSMWGILAARALTFLLVVIAWVFFRAENFVAAKSLLVSMTGAHGLSSNLARIHVDSTWFTIVPLLLAVWFLPNTHQLLARFEPTLEYAEGKAPPAPAWAFWKRRPSAAATPRWLWRPGLSWAIAIAALAVSSVLGLSRIAEFIYWQF
jgi:D-alanyl-lipoteichoic acid acyltransferase DltB (MBOAT superfamily)